MRDCASLKERNLMKSFADKASLAKPAFMLARLYLIQRS
jgi:hypothetical protein